MGEIKSSDFITNSFYIDYRYVIIRSYRMKARKEMFSKGGMIIAPDHNIQVNTPIENIIAIYKTIGSLKPNNMIIL